MRAELIEISRSLIEHLMEKGETVTTVESCTGGLLSAAIVDVPGASNVFRQGLVTYSNEAKERLAFVRAGTLEAFGAVSKETAEEMACGGARAAGANLSIATTGIAGPGGAAPDKPVGLVYIGIFYNGKIFVERNIFAGNREEIRTQTVERALSYARSIAKQ